MIKFVNKNKLQYKNGLLVDKKGRVVMIDETIIDQLNMLETKVQQQDYLKAQPKATPIPSLKGFERASIHDLNGFEVLPPKTPVMDKRIEEGLAFAKEAESAYTADKANDILRTHLRALAEFVANDEVVVSYDSDVLTVIDTPTLGNPLTLTEADLIQAVLWILGVDADVHETEEEE